MSRWKAWRRIRRKGRRQIIGLEEAIERELIGFIEEAHASVQLFDVCWDRHPRLREKVKDLVRKSDEASRKADDLFAGLRFAGPRLVPAS